MTFRLRVLVALTECLETITPENGYAFNLAPGADGHDQHVFRGRNRFGEDDPDELLSILEPPIPLEAFTNNAVDNTDSNSEWELLVQGFVPDDKVHPTDQAHVFMGAVKKRLRQEMRRLKPDGSRDPDILGLADDEEGEVLKITIGQGVARPPDETSDRAFFWLLVKLQLAEIEV